MLRRVRVCKPFNRTANLIVRVSVTFLIALPNPRTKQDKQKTLEKKSTYRGKKKVYFGPQVERLAKARPPVTVCFMVRAPMDAGVPSAFSVELQATTVAPHLGWGFLS